MKDSFSFIRHIICGVISAASPPQRNTLPLACEQIGHNVMYKQIITAAAPVGVAKRASENAGNIGDNVKVMLIKALVLRFYALH